MFLVSVVHALTPAAIRLTPACLSASDTLLVETNLWPHAYHYNNRVIREFIFDGYIGVTPDTSYQTDYHKSWSQTLRIPAHASSPGSHSLLIVQLERYDTGYIGTGCTSAIFQITTTPTTPWQASDDTTLDSRPPQFNKGQKVNFDPAYACDVTQCKAIRLIQAIQPLAIISGTPEQLSLAGMVWGTSAESLKTAGGFAVDQFSIANRDPYTNGNDFIDTYTFSTVGFGYYSLTNAARMMDAPAWGDLAFPTNATEVILRVEDCAFCSQGDQQGQFLGSYRWRWRRPKSGNAVIDSIVSSRAQPSPEFQSALTRFGQVRAFTLPKPVKPSSKAGCQ